MYLHFASSHNNTPLKTKLLWPIRKKLHTRKSIVTHTSGSPLRFSFSLWFTSCKEMYLGCNRRWQCWHSQVLDAVQPVWPSLDPLKSVSFFYKPEYGVRSPPPPQGPRSHTCTEDDADPGDGCKCKGKSGKKIFVKRCRYMRNHHQSFISGNVPV